MLASVTLYIELHVTCRTEISTMHDRRAHMLSGSALSGHLNFLLLPLASFLRNASLSNRLLLLPLLSRCLCQTLHFWTHKSGHPSGFPANPMNRHHPYFSIRGSGLSSPVANVLWLESEICCMWEGKLMQCFKQGNVCFWQVKGVWVSRGKSRSKDALAQVEAKCGDQQVWRA